MEQKATASTVKMSRDGIRSLCLVSTLALMMIFLYRTTRSIVDPDIWHEMALAREIFTLGYLPWSDHFAYTPTVYPVVHHEWGAGVIAYVVATWLGAPGLAALRNGLTVGLAMVTWRAARRRGAQYSTLSFLVPLAILMADEGFSPIRAQMYSFLFLAIMLNCLDQDRLKKGWTWKIGWLLLFLVWLNVHAGFLVGAGLFAIYWFELWIRGLPHAHVLKIGLIMVPMILINPYGIHYFTYLWHGVSLNRPNVDEWRSIGSANLLVQSCMCFSIAIFMYAIRCVGPRRGVGILLILATLAAAIASARMLPFYAIVWLIFVPSWLKDSVIAVQFQNLWSQLTIACMVVWLSAALIFGARWLENRPYTLIVPGQLTRKNQPNHLIYPVSAVSYLNEVAQPTNLMVTFDVGAYVSWKLVHVPVKVAIDSRYEVAYRPQLAIDNYRIYMAEEGWQELLNSTEETDAILIPSWLPVADRIAELSKWHRVYYDPNYAIYAKDGFPLPIRSESSLIVAGSIP